MSDETARQDGVGEPDGLDRLWTPHRMAYIRGENKPADATRGGVPVLPGPRRDDDDGLVVARGELAYAVLNLYPYSPGHLMVCPYRHIADYTETTDEEAAEIGDLTKQAMTVVRVGVGGPGLQHRDEPGRASPAPASPPTCTSTSCRAGRATRTSCRSSAAPRPCPSCSPTPATCWPRPGPIDPFASLPVRPAASRVGRHRRRR